MAGVRKFIFGDLISFVLVIAIILGVASFALSLSQKTTKTVSSLSFSVGSLNNDGSYKKSKTSIYTKELFECEGLTVTLDFEADLEYQVFYYVDKYTYVGRTGKMSEEYSRGDDCPEAKYARIVITPELGDSKEEIYSWEAFNYARYLKITVNK